MKLIEASMEYDAQIQAYRSEFLRSGGSMDGCGSLRRYADTAAWLEQLEAAKDPQRLPPDRVPSTTYLGIRETDGKLVGMLQIRHPLNETLERYAGHIGYSVAPAERRKGCATAMLAAALEICRQMGLERVLLSCRPENEGSRRTILHNGGIYEETVYWPERELYLERYRIELGEGAGR